MRSAELSIAAALMGLSIFFMIYAVALPIGWVPEAGPGGGAFPFWLSAIMFLCAGAIFVRTLSTQSTGPFFDPQTSRSVAVVSLAILVTIAVMAWAGTYVALTLFLLFYLRIYGRHGWTVVVPITAMTPVVLFFFFEVTLKILLPKGITEPLFFPLYAMFF